MTRAAKLSIHKDCLLCDKLAIITKRMYLFPIGYLQPWKITDKLLLIKESDNEGQTFENIVPNKEIKYIYILQHNDIINQIG